MKKTAKARTRINGDPAGRAVWIEPVTAGTPKKRAISLRLDAGVVEWFRAQGPRYQSLINAVLAAYVRAASEGTKEGKAR